MKVIGLTGGIGSGKSTVAQLFAELQIPIIDADVIARDLTVPQAPAFQKIVKHYGPEILKNDGSLDRGKLRQFIFNDVDEKEWLEELLHPLIIQEIKNRLPQLREAAPPYCLVVMPLLIETGPYPFIHRILVVNAPLEKRLERAQTRDHATLEELKKIIAAQASQEESLDEAHDAIHNYGDREELREQVTRLHQQYLNLP